MVRAPAVRTGVLFLAALVLAATVIPATASTRARQVGTQPSFVVTLSEDGSAEMAATVTFALDTAPGAAAFSKFSNNETARENLRTSFLDRMRAAAANGTNATGREMTVLGASIDSRTAGGGSVGVIVLSARWTGLAAVGNGSLLVTEPFATAFQPERTFVVRWPDGYTVDTAAPPPDETSETSATWERDTQLNGFELRVVESPAGGTDGGIPALPVAGFGVGGVIVALLVALLVELLVELLVTPSVRS